MDELEKFTKTLIQGNVTVLKLNLGNLDLESQELKLNL
jgi:hypothetical protein